MNYYLKNSKGLVAWMAIALLAFLFSTVSQSNAANNLADGERRLAASPAQNACTVSLTPAEISGDYISGGNAFITMSTLVSWSDLPADDTITVSLKDSAGNIIESRTFTQKYAPLDYDPSDPENNPWGMPADTPYLVDTVPLQDVAFEVAADGSSTYMVEATSSSACSTAAFNVTAPTGYTSPICSAADLGGQVYKDFDMDGIQAPAETIGIENVTVTVYGSDGSTMNTQSDRYGQYVMAVPNAAYPVRVEFTSIGSSPYFETSGPAGANSQSTVQFIAAPSCTVDLGLTDPNLSCQANPDVMISCFVSGDPLSQDVVNFRSAARDIDTLVSFSYDLTGNKDVANMSMLATGIETGSVWGVAWDRYQSRFYSAAALLRAHGLGPLGLGGVYVTDYTPDSDGAPNAWDAAGTTGAFFDITTLNDTDGTPINVGSISSNVDRGLTANPSEFIRDEEAFGLIGKVGLGDIDIAGDGSALYVTNLHELTLVEVPLPADGSAPTEATSFTIPTNFLNCQNGVQRPWATKVHEGKVFVGINCTGENSGSQVDLAAGVLRFDPLTQAWDMIFDFPLTYLRGHAHCAPGSSLGTQWNPWTDDITMPEWYLDARDNTGSRLGEVVQYAQPIFSDIEFDIDGSMVLTMADRGSFQIQGGLGPDPAQDDRWDGGIISTVAGGDVLRAFYGGGDTYIMENNGKAGPSVGALPNSVDGPGLGEFYDDAFECHTENATGAVALNPGSGEAVVPVVDPIHLWSNGIRFVDNTTGAQLRNYTVVEQIDNGRLYDSKSANLGDVELACRLPEVLEIGNRIWLDANEDGIQDPNEAVAPNVTVILYDAAGNEVARRDTAADGTYYFNTADGLMPNTGYYVVIDPAEFTSGDLQSWIYPTLPFGGASQNDSNVLTLTAANDSSLPAALEGTLGASITTGNYNENDHTIDMGLAAVLVNLIIGDTVWLDTDQDGAQDLVEEGIAGVTVDLYNDEGTLVNTTTTNGDGQYIFNKDSAGENLVPDDYYIVVEPPAGYEFTVQQSTGDNTNDSDVDPATGQSDTHPVGANEVNLTFDAGLVPVMSIASNVFYDDNDNGELDNSETGIDKLTVELYDRNNNLLATTVTDSDGDYYFGNLEPGQYYVRIPNPPVDAPMSSTPTEIDPNDDVDNNDNGIQTGGSGAPVVSNFITLIGDNEPTNEVGSGSDQDDANEDNGNMTVDFGFVKVALLGDYVWLDVNGNGVQDSNEAGIPDVIVTLMPPAGIDLGAGAGQPITTMTDGSGRYLFENLPAQDGYVVMIDVTQPALQGAGLSYTTPNNSGNSNQADEGNQDPTGYTIDLSAGEHDQSGDFGFAEVGSIGDYVWLDENNDGIQNSDEVGIQGVTVTLTPPAGIDLGAGAGQPITVETDANGRYLFDTLPAADGYVVTVDETQSVLVDADLVYTEPTSTNQDPKGYTVNLGAGEAIVSADFGFYEEPKPTAVSFQSGQAAPVGTMLFTLMALFIAGLLGFVFYRQREAFR